MKKRNEMRSDSTEYYKGYADGMKAAFEESELDAYYAGVGYGKKAAGDKYLGFNSAKEREQFEHGVSKKDHHFNAYRGEPPTFLEKMFGIGVNRREQITVKNRRQDAREKVKRTSKKRNAKFKKFKKVQKNQENKRCVRLQIGMYL